MNRIKVFLILAFIASLTLCILSLLIAGDPAALILFRIGAVTAVITGVGAMADHIHDYLLSNGDNE